MADDSVTVDNGTGTDYTVASDQIAGVEYQKVKLVDGTADSTTPVASGGGVEAGALRVTVASDSTGVLSVDDNGASLSVDDGGASLTVDGTVGITGTVTVDSELTTADLDTGGGTDTRAVVGLVGQASGGGELIGSTSNALDVNIKSGGAGDGALLDGVSSAIKATVLDYVNSNPLAVRLTDTGGDYVAAGAGTQYTEDDAAPANPVGGQLVARRRDSLASETTLDGDVTALNSTAKGELYVKHVDAIPVTDNAGSLTVDGTVTANLAAGTNNIGDVDVLTVPAPLSTTGGGTEATALRVTVASDSTGVLSVDDNGASLTVDGTVTASNTAGDVAHDGVDSGNPVKVGVKALSALPTAVATADRANAIGDLFGRVLTAHIDPAMQVWKSVNVTTQQTGSDVWTPASGKKIAVTHLQVAAYGTTAGRVILWFGANADTTYTAGTDQVLFAGSFAPSATSKPGALPPITFPIFCTTADYEIHLTTDAAISLDITVYGYEF